MGVRCSAELGGGAEDELAQVHAPLHVPGRRPGRSLAQIRPVLDQVPVLVALSAVTERQLGEAETGRGGLKPSVKGTLRILVGGDVHIGPRSMPQEIGEH